jgi:hypothetical protein
MHAVDLSSLYRLPWTKDDNPDGWIEVTTYCQLKCPGCYRGLAEPNPVRAHERLDGLMRDIDTLIATRNIQTLSIAGGEPLLYPELAALIRYASGKRLKTKIFTNGHSLTRQRLLDLKEAGATEFVVHIDKFQSRPGTAIDPAALREGFCSLFREVGGVNLGFIMPASGNDFTELAQVVELCKRNVDVVNLLVITPYKDMLPNSISYGRHALSATPVPALSAFLCEAYGSRPCAFLGKIHDPDLPSWLFMVPLVYGGKIVGHMDGGLYKDAQERYRAKTGRYFITRSGNTISKTFIPRLLASNAAPRLVKETLLRPTADLRYQVVLIIDGPTHDARGWNLCDGCPDAMLHDGKLVPSCLLERVKAGERIALPR